MTKVELKKLIKSFKPQVGNLNHIRALELIKKMDKKDQLFVKLKGVKDEILEVSEEIRFEAQHLEYLINN